MVKLLNVLSRNTFTYEKKIKGKKNTNFNKLNVITKFVKQAQTFTQVF